MLNNLRKQLAFLGLKFNKSQEIEVIQVKQTSERESELRKRINKAFKEQEQQMQQMALGAHEAGCDIFSCKSNPCFIRVPDQIVSESYPVETIKLKNGRKVPK